VGRRVLIYALVYGSIGVAVGVLLALYTKDVEVPRNIVLKSKQNGSAVTAETSVPVESQVEEPSN